MIEVKHGKLDEPWVRNAQIVEVVVELALGLWLFLWPKGLVDLVSSLRKMPSQ